MYLCKIVIVTSRPRLGVSTLLGRLVRGLVIEGYKVNIVNVKRRNLPTQLIDDLRMLNYYDKYDIAMYSGTSYLSPLFSSVSKKYVIIHGYLIDEILYGLLTSPILAKISHLMSLLSWLLVKESKLTGIICHSNATFLRSLAKVTVILLFCPNLFLKKMLEHIKNSEDFVQRKKYVPTL